MSDIIDISKLHKNFKSDLEKKEFVEAQHRSIISLNKQIQEQQEEIAQLKTMLAQNPNNVQKVILSPEQALIEEQIFMIQQRSYAKELTLEDVKKLDILLKNKNLIKEKDTLKADSKKLGYTNVDLVQIAQGPTNESK